MTSPRRYPLVAGEMATCFDRDPKGERVRLLDENTKIVWRVRREDGSIDEILAGYLQAGDIV